MAIPVPAAGKMLGRYQVLKPLAKGGMAEVFLARTVGLKGFERHVVLKFIRVEHGMDQKSIDMLLDEARLVASLHHRNIVQVHDVGEGDGQYFFAMEYVHGEDTRALLRKVKDKKALLPFSHILTIITAAAAGLHYAHEMRGPDRKPLGIVHRDISPGNILLGFDGGVKVVDFGIAKTDAQAENTSAGEMKGKVGYMSPEQCKALPLDRRTDIYMLGIVMYELCTVRRLFKGENRYETMQQIVEGNIPPPSRYRKDLPDELEQIIMKALATNPDDRYQSADDLRLVLEAYATRTNLQISPSKLSDYLKELFGERPEPWLVDAPPPDIAPGQNDTYSSLPRISAPVIATKSERGDATPLPAPARPSSADVLEPGTGTGNTPMAWPVDSSTQRKRRNLLLGVVGGGVLAAGAVAFAMMGGDSSSKKPAAAAGTSDGAGAVGTTGQTPDKDTAGTRSPDKPDTAGTGGTGSPDKPDTAGTGSSGTPDTAGTGSDNAASGTDGIAGGRTGSAGAADAAATAGTAGASDGDAGTGSGSGGVAAADKPDEKRPGTGRQGGRTGGRQGGRTGGRSGGNSGSGAKPDVKIKTDKGGGEDLDSPFPTD